MNPTQDIQDSNKTDNGNITLLPNSIRVGKEKPQAPAGKYIARCVHVESNWTFLKNRKIALYFEISESEHAGKTARRFYNLKKLHDGSYEIAPKSKFLKDVRKLFPDESDKGELNPTDLFLDKFFDIEVVRCFSNAGGATSIVQELELNDTGF